MRRISKIMIIWGLVLGFLSLTAAGCRKQNQGLGNQFSQGTNSSRGHPALRGKELVKLIRVKLKDYAEEMELLKKRAYAEGKQKAFRKLEYVYDTRSCSAKALLFRVTSAGTENLPRVQVHLRNALNAFEKAYKTTAFQFNSPPNGNNSREAVR